MLRAPDGANAARGERGEEVLRKVLLPASLFTIAFAVRLVSWPSVVGESRIVFFGMDAWYHMRRVLYSLVNGGETLGFDPYVNYPHGAQPIWPPSFDGVVALLLAPVYAVADWRTVELAAALIPPVLGAACVVVSWSLARKLFAPNVALLAAAMLCFLSAHTWYSQLGFLDHHVATALLATLLLSSAVGLLNQLSPRVPRWSDAWAGHAAVGALSAFALLVWPGTVMHVGLVAIAMLVFAATRSPREDAVRAATGCASIYGVALVLVAPVAFSNTSSQWGAVSPVVLSWFQPWMFASLALHSLVCAWLWRRARGGSPVVRVGQSLAIGALFAIASAVAFPGLVAGGEDAWSWFTKDEVFQGIVSESQPLFFGSTGWDGANAVLRLSHFVWLFPISLFGLAWHARRSEHRPALFLLLFSATALAAATLLQRRFFNSFSPLFAIVVAWSCIEVVRRLTRALHAGGRVARVGVVGVVGAAGLWLFAPTLAAYRVPIENLRKADDALLTVPRPELARRRMLEAAEWLGEHTPPTSGYLDADSSPEYGVLAPWGYGHLLKYVAQRPTVVGNFGDDVGEGNLRRVEAYLRSAEHDASPILDSLNARYVVVETLARAGPAMLERDTMRSRLSQDDSPGLERHRLLWESSLDGRPRTPRSELRIFEHVRGAVIDGAAPPGERVRAALAYTSNRGRNGTFETSAVAGPEGRYRMRVPYSTRGAPPGVTTQAGYRIVSGGRTVGLPVEEAAVQQGLSVEGPAFVADSPR